MGYNYRKLVRRFFSGIKNPLAISGDGKIIVTHDYMERRMFIWDVNTKTSRVIDDLEVEDSAIAITPDGNTVIAGSKHDITIVDVATSSKVVREHSFAFYEHVALSSDGKFIAAARPGSIRVFDASTETLVTTIITNTRPEHIAIASQGSFIACSNGDDIRIVDGAGPYIRTLPRTWSFGSATAIAISSDNNFIVAAYGNGIFMWKSPSSVANLAYARRGYFIDEAEKIREQAKAIRKFPKKRLQAIHKGIDLLKSADVKRKDFEDYIGKIKNRIKQEFTQGLIEYIKSVGDRANRTQDFPDELRKAIYERIERLLKDDQSQPDFAMKVNEAVQDVERLLEEGLEEIRRQNLLAPGLGGF